jgi:hypothetical protein
MSSETWHIGDTDRKFSLPNWLGHIGNEVTRPNGATRTWALYMKALGEGSVSKQALAGALAPTAVAFAPLLAKADEGGVSFWVPGFFGSLAAAPLQPGWSLSTIYYHTSVSAGGDVAVAREVTLGRIPANLSLSTSLNANVNAQADAGFLVITYVLPTPVLGGQASFAMLGAYERVNTSLAAQLSGVLSGTAMIAGGPVSGSLAFSRSDTINSLTWGFGDLVPQFALRWNAGVNNYMLYVTGDAPVGAYDPNRLSNTGIGHGAVDAGVGYTYFNQKTGQEFSGVLGFTYNMTNQSTQYQNGIDMHFDWAASQFLTKQFQVGLVGYIYDEVGCDSGSGDRVGCFQSRVFGVGPQLGFIIPISHTTQGYLNLKAYEEFDYHDRAHGWNAWVTFVLSPAQQPPSASSRRTRSM